MKNIVIIGFMGTGKTTISSNLAKMLELKEVDTDQYIEEKEQMSIQDIFEQKGEAYFRILETEILIELMNQQNLILSCGGGMALKKENREIMKKTGIVIWLSASPYVILNRVKGNTSRPLLNGNMNIEFISEMIKKRTPAYEDAATYKVVTDDKTVKEICQEIVNKVMNS